MTCLVVESAKPQGRVGPSAVLGAHPCCVGLRRGWWQVGGGVAGPYFLQTLFVSGKDALGTQGTGVPVVNGAQTLDKSWRPVCRCWELGLCRGDRSRGWSPHQWDAFLIEEAPESSSPPPRENARSLRLGPQPATRGPCPQTPSPGAGERPLFLGCRCFVIAAGANGDTGHRALVLGGVFCSFNDHVSAWPL